MIIWRVFGVLHKVVYERSGGRLGANLCGRTMLLLTTTGRKSGKARSLPLAYLADGDDLIVVASNGGEPTHPAWWLNLRENPQAKVQVGRERFAVTASRAGAEERARLWPRLKAYNPPYAHYERKTEREIPVVILRRAAT